MHPSSHPSGDPVGPHPFDTLIVGGGLAGSAAAILLAQAGYRVLLLEQHRYPRHKMCGEFLSPETVPLFERLGVWERVRDARPAPLTSVRITEPGGKRLDIPFPVPALGLSRYRLDALLLEHARAAGATVREGCAVSEIQGSLAQGFAARTHEGNVQARVVLGAWGKRSTLDRTLARPFFARRGGFVALKAHVRGPITEGRTELHAFPGGYCGLNRVEDETVNACLLATDAAWARGGKKIASFWAMIQQQNPALAEQLSGAAKVSEDIVISNISFARKQPIVQDILMLGDGAELISPLAGNGQAMALRAALLATPLVGAFLSGQIDAATLCQRYAQTWHGQFRQRLLLGRLLQPLFLHPPALALGLHAAHALPPLGPWLVRATREHP